MLKILEPTIYLIYISAIIYLAIYLYKNSMGNKLYKAFASFALTLGLTDGIHLLTRIYALLTTGIEENLHIIGWGRMGSAILTSILFLFLYDIYNLRYEKRPNQPLNRFLYGLAIIRTILCILPMNKWFETVPSTKFALIRFIPLAIIGGLLTLVIYIHSKKDNDLNFIYIGVATLISTIFSEPYMFFNQASPGLVIFILIKSIALLLIIIMGYIELREINILNRY